MQRFIAKRTPAKGLSWEGTLQRKKVERMIEILLYFQPRAWVLQIPRQSRLLDVLALIEFPFVDIDVCQFWKLYRNRYRFWGIHMACISTQVTKMFSIPPHTFYVVEKFGGHCSFNFFRDRVFSCLRSLPFISCRPPGRWGWKGFPTKMPWERSPIFLSHRCPH